MMTSESSNDEGVASSLEATQGTNQFQSTSLNYSTHNHNRSVHPVHAMQALIIKTTYGCYGRSLQSQINNEPALDTTYQSEGSANKPTYSTGDYKVPETPRPPQETNAPPPHLTKQLQENWDIMSQDLPEYQHFDEFENWPDGNQLKVYSMEVKRAKRHQSGWAMRNTNNHNPAILKKSCLGVLVCSNGCVGEDGREICYRPAICDKARRKQHHRLCPIIGCGGRMIQRPCKGNGGFPVTHFWRVERGAVFFQCKGEHSHPKPRAKIPNEAPYMRNLGLSNSDSVTPPASTGPSMDQWNVIEPETHSVESNPTLLQIRPTLDLSTPINAIAHQNATADFAAFELLELRPPHEERQQLNLLSAFNDGLPRDPNANHTTLPPAEQAFYTLRQGNRNTERLDFNVDRRNVENTMPPRESQQVESSSHITTQYTSAQLQDFILQYENGGVARAQTSSPSVSVLQQSPLFKTCSVVEDYGQAQHSNGINNMSFFSPIAAGSSPSQFDTPPGSGGSSNSDSWSAFHAYSVRSQLESQESEHPHDHPPSVLYFDGSYPY